jgi:beta-N-acetylhexosaminidase
MKAIADRYGACDAARRAKAAGSDVILPLGPLDEQIGVVDAMCAAVEAGELPLSVFEATARRLDTLRNAYNFSHELPPFAEPGQILYDRALEVARRSITVIGSSDALPLARQTRLALIDCLLPRFSLVEEAYARADSLSGLVSRAFPQMRSLTVGAEPTDEDVNRALELLHDAEAVLLITRNVVLSPQRTRFVQAIGTVSIPVIHVAVGLPYDAGLVTNAATTILTYGDPDVSLTALLDVLTGKVTAHGISPITLNVPRKDATS